MSENNETLLENKAISLSSVFARKTFLVKYYCGIKRIWNEDFNLSSDLLLIWPNVNTQRCPYYDLLQSSENSTVRHSIGLLSSWNSDIMYFISTFKLGLHLRLYSRHTRRESYDVSKW